MPQALLECSAAEQTVFSGVVDLSDTVLEVLFAGKVIHLDPTMTVIIDFLTDQSGAIPQ